MRRREFITLVGGATVVWPLGARAQQPSIPVIGYLGTGTSSTQREWLATFTQRLHELGWREGTLELPKHLISFCLRRFSAVSIG